MATGLAVVANFHGNGHLRQGAKVVVLRVTGDPSQCLVRGLSIGGRRVTTWVAMKKLTNGRVVAWLPESVKRMFQGYHGRTPEMVVQMISEG